MSNKHIKEGYFDPSIIVQKQQTASFYRGRESSSEYKTLMNEKVFSIYEKNGKLIPVTRLANPEDGDLEGSWNLKTKVLSSVVGATEVVPAVTLGMFNKCWDHNKDGALGNKVESLNEVGKVLHQLVGEHMINMALKGGTSTPKRSNDMRLQYN